ncbi:hypothetical protein CMO90_00335 [Candidatus Woesearchaeota archaeon]|jgi:hypothetical protein|nr:hypothetical protein [Candidatus Woesearchaeota archaeon]|tara:strand:+ start:706 stop:1047 length:342 start_codon:yes stop_codon:yes gene_type:complete
MIKNYSKGIVLVEKEEICNSDFAKARGLMFSRKTDKALIFPFRKSKRISLHMFFVFFSIDVLFLDEKKIVVELKNCFKPFTFYFSKRKVKYVVELPVNTIKRTKTIVGDKIGF